MSGAIVAEPREGIVNHANLNLGSTTHSSPDFLAENRQIRECADEAAAVEEAWLDVCRICQFPEPDKTEEAALRALGISACSAQHANASTSQFAVVGSFVEKEKVSSSTDCTTVNTHVNSLIDLGCACKRDLALVHYACALRWFVSRGSLLCEVCGVPALNVSRVDCCKVLYALKAKNALQNQVPVTSVMSDVEGMVASLAIPRFSDGMVRLPAWFTPVCEMRGVSRSLSEEMSESYTSIDGYTPRSPTTKWAIEAAGILIATGLLSIGITWLLSPRVDKGVTRTGRHVLLGAFCGLSILVFLRFLQFSKNALTCICRYCFTQG